MDVIRKAQENQEPGAHRVHSALEQKRGAEVSVRTMGRVMAVHRDLYALGKPKRSSREKAEMPFRAKRRHEFWTADVRYVPHSIPDTGNAYVIAILENYSRCILSSAVSLTQDTTAFLRVFYSAVERYGPPERLVTNGGGIFKASQSRAVYRALGLEKEQIERRKPYQSYIETTFGIQKRMADWHFAKAETFPDLARAHDTWMEDYNAQRHWAHEGREDGRRSPRDVLGIYMALLRHREEDLKRAFFSTRHARVLDPLGYVRFLDWRLYGQEALARREAAVWLQPGSLTLEYGGEALSAYDVELSRESGKPKAVGARGCSRPPTSCRSRGTSRPTRPAGSMP
jgi:transposase InsO family protein